MQGIDNGGSYAGVGQVVYGKISAPLINSAVDLNTFFKQ
jgi:hypothetical protein